MSGKSRIEKILENLLGGDNVIEPPIGRDEKILYSILNDLEYTEPPHGIFEELLLAIKNSSPLETEYAYEYLTRDEKILFCKLNRREYFEPPHSRLEKLLIKWLYLDLYLNIDGVPPFTFVSNGSPIVDYIISGNEEHSGTPTPDNPIMPEGTGERTGQIIEYPYCNESGVINGVQWTISENGHIKGIGTTSSGTNFYINQNCFLKAGTYTLKIYGKHKGMVLRIYDSVNTTIIATMPQSNTDSSVTFTLDSDTSNDCRIYFNVGSAGIAVDIDCDIMFNSGSTALPYEPYGYKLDISCGGTATPVYLGEVETTRRIKKLVLTGEEFIYVYANADIAFRINTSDAMLNYRYCVCTHFVYQRTPGNSKIDGVTAGAGDYNLYFTFSSSSAAQFGVVARDTNSFKSYLAQQYANGTPVTVWYVLATETTGIVNEPLMKIGDYADTVSKEQAGVSIPTVSGRNTFDVLGDVKPSNVELTYAPRAPLLGKRKTVLKK